MKLYLKNSDSLMTGIFVKHGDYWFKSDNWGALWNPTEARFMTNLNISSLFPFTAVDLGTKTINAGGHEGAKLHWALNFTADGNITDAYQATFTTPRAKNIQGAYLSLASDYYNGQSITITPTGTSDYSENRLIARIDDVSGHSLYLVITFTVTYTAPNYSVSATLVYLNNATGITFNNTNYKTPCDEILEVNRTDGQTAEEAMEVAVNASATARQASEDVSSLEQTVQDQAETIELIDDELNDRIDSLVFSKI